MRLVMADDLIDDEVSEEGAASGRLPDPDPAMGRLRAGAGQYRLELLCRGSDDDLREGVCIGIDRLLRGALRQVIGGHDHRDR